MMQGWFNALLSSTGILPLPDCDTGTYDLDAQNVIDKMVALGAAVDSTREGYINTLITGFKTDGDWEKLACLQMFNSPTSASSLFNWTNIYVFFPTLVNSPTFSANSGYTGNGTTSYINHNFHDGLSELTNLNDITLFWWNLTNDAQTTIIGGANKTSGTSESLIQPKRADTSKAGADLNSASPANQTTNTISDATGLWSIQRTNSTQFSIYRNATLLDTFSANSVSKLGLKYYGLALNLDNSATGFSSRKLTLFGAGSGSLNVANVYSRLSTYLTSIGAI